jgi:hypothetical protein
MRALLLLLVCVTVLGACKSRDMSDEAARHPADTTLRARTVHDTLIVTHDTLVRADTIVKSATPAADSAARKRTTRP